MRLRVGPEVYANPEQSYNSGMASWVKGNEFPEILQRKTRKSKKKEKDNGNITMKIIEIENGNGLEQ